ncbi:hypothetical protein LDENG_00019860 [Lucifuga dentata]|nr:hypothetical protein LDENG_00019860 [Lucifuga dentata]
MSLFHPGLTAIILCILESTSSSLNRLHLVQNATAQLLTCTCKRYHISPTLASLRWLLVRCRIDFKILPFVFNSLNVLAPPYLSDLLCPNTLSRSLRSADQMLLVILRSRFKGPYRPFCMFEPNIFSFHTCYVTDSHFPKDETVFQLS